MTCVWSAEADEYRCSSVSDECGNGLVEPGESCDGEALGGQTCISLGYVGGTLACTTGCELDTAGCDVVVTCDNGVLDPGEECDGANLGGQTCEGLGMGGGALGCTLACIFDLTGCDDPPVCGNGQLEYGEACDDGNTIDGDGCQANYALPGCGDGIFDPGEDCDGANLSGQTCGGLGWDGGVLGCSAGCSFDESSCFMNPFCGDGAIDPGEDCEGANLGGQTCGGLGWDGGVLSCSAGCSFDVANCYSWDLASISAGAYHSCAVASDGTAWCWGEGDSGRLDNGSTLDQTAPVQVSE